MQHYFPVSGTVKAGIWVKFYSHPGRGQVTLREEQKLTLFTVTAVGASNPTHCGCRLSSSEGIQASNFTNTNLFLQNAEYVANETQTGGDERNALEIWHNSLQ
jgi:hypothetical protein